MDRALAGAVALAVFAGAAGCGQKGPLVRRNAKPGATVTTSAPASATSTAPAAGAPPATPPADEPDATRRP
jgi:predicted small lipoprotein YifL